MGTGALLLAAALAVGCSSSPPTQTSNAPTTPATAPPATSATTGAPSATTSGAGDLGEAPVLDTGAAAGSGCSPGGDTLPDGWWFGTVPEEVGDSLALDLECFFVGAAAQAAAAEDGEEVANDVYLRNDSDTIRTTPLAAGVVAQCLPAEGTPDLRACPPSEVSGPVWIRVVGGEVDRILEQFFP
jgi:hypothetical protein